MPQYNLKLLLQFSLIITGLLCFTLTAAAQEPQPAPANGQALWPENCAPCHGATGQGDGPTAQSIPNPIPKLSDPALSRQAVPSDYFNTIKNGRIEKMMPPWKNRLNDQQMADLTAYVLNLSLTPADLSAGKMTYNESCASCHGAEGAPTAQGGQVSFKDWAVMSTQSISNMQANFKASAAHEPFKGLTETELGQTLGYIRNLSFILPRDDGVLQGKIINGSTQKAVPNVAVELHLIQNNSEIETRTVKADSQGNYRFSDLSTNPAIQYAIEAKYADIFYRSPEPATFAANSVKTTADLKVYDTTTSAAEVYVPQLHYLISPGVTDVRVIQIFVVGNRGKETYIGQNGQTFRFNVPDNAQNVEFQNDVTGKRFIKTANGYADSEPITPGEESSSILVSYNIPHDGRLLTLKNLLPQEVTSVSALLQERGATLTSDQLQFTANRDIQGDKFGVYAGKDLKANEMLVITLGNLDKLTFPTEADNAAAVVTPNSAIDQNALLYSTLGMGLLTLLLAVVVYPLVRPRSEDVTVRRQKLLLLLVRLDELFTQGELDEAIYRPARAEYKAELVSLMEE